MSGKTIGSFGLAFATAITMMSGCGKDEAQGTAEQHRTETPAAGQKKPHATQSAKEPSTLPVPPRVQAAMAILKDDSATAPKRYAAVKALGHLGPEASAAIPLLVEQLKDYTPVYSDWDLVSIKPTDKPDIVQFSGSRVSLGPIAYIAAEALTSITGKDFGHDYDVWVQVLRQQKLTGKLQLAPAQLSELKRYRNEKLGFTARDVSLQERVSQQRARGDYGVIVETVEMTGTAAKAGLAPGDVISDASGRYTRTVATLQEVMNDWRGKSYTMDFTIYRDTQKIKVEFKAEQ
jgi:hypothetical protein